MASGISKWKSWGIIYAPQPASADPVEELLGAAFHVKAGILLGLVARKPRDALYKSKIDYAAHMNMQRSMAEAPVLQRF